MKSENDEDGPLHELPRHSSTGFGDRTQSGPTNEPSSEGQENDGVQDEEEVKHAPGHPESRGSAEPRLEELTVLRDHQSARTTANAELIKSEDVSDDSSCSAISPKIKSSRSPSQDSVRSPSAAAAETSFAPGFLETSQSLAGEEQAKSSLSQGPITDHPVCRPTQTAATSVEPSRKRSFDGGAMENDDGTSKRRKAGNEKDECENNGSLARQKPSPLGANRQSSFSSNRSGTSANQSQDLVSNAQRKSPGNDGARPQSAASSAPPPSKAPVRLYSRADEDSNLQALSRLGDYVPLTMATTRRRYTEFAGG